MPTFDIILTSYERIEYLKRTVASLISSGAFSACQRFIIVDNHSLDPKVQEFLGQMATYKNTFILRRPVNDGWATAVNDALGVSRAEFVLLINNDVEFKPDFHEKMLRLWGSPILAPEGTKGVGIVGAWHHTAHSFTGYEFHGFKETTDVPAVCWMLDKGAMEKVGMLPEHGPCLTKGGNGEDSKYVQMMKAQGYLVGVTSEDVATHIDGY